CLSRLGAALALLAVVLLVGCGDSPNKGPGKAPVEPVKKEDDAEATAARIAAERAKLSAEDRQLVEEQEFCPVMPAERLGSMGPPRKEMVNGKPVFLCCKSCIRRLHQSPDKYLAKAEEM